MRECETKMFFWGCGLNPSLYGNLFIELAIAIYTVPCMYSNFGRESPNIRSYTVSTYRFWPALLDQVASVDPPTLQRRKEREILA
jgi:hypothetical protein